MPESSAQPEPLRDDLRKAIQALASAVEALTQATQVLHGTANMMVQAMQGQRSGLGAGAAQGQINVWEDDPFSEAVSTENPVVAPPVTATVPGVRL